MAEPLLKKLDFSVLQQCMHCGMCLPTCPTYAETKRERSSPRGRIALMRAIAEEEISISDTFAEEVNYCLGCLACVSACPAGVNYPALLETARADAEQAGVSKTSGRRFIRWALMRQLFTRPRLFHFVGRALRLYQRSGAQSFVRRVGLLRLLPRGLRELEPLTPVVERKFSDQLIAPLETPKRATRRVAVLTGCVQDIVFAEVNRATVDVLLENGCEVLTPKLQGCCGSLHAHNGDLETARVLARRMIDLIQPESVDAIISNAAGCGSHLKHYGPLLSEDPQYAKRAELWDEKARDIFEWLVEIGFRRPTASPFADTERGEAKTAVTYHDACHLCHGQGITRQPREILRAIPGVELRECAESTWCCGSAGVYALIHPDTAGRLRERKWSNLEATGAAVVSMANPGCMLHLNTRQGEGPRPPLEHPVVLLARAYRAEKRT